MKLFRVVFVAMALSLGLLAPAAVAQTQTLVVPGTPDNNQAGVMFDIVAANDVTITGFTLTQILVGGTFRVYGRDSTFVGNSTSSAGWRLLSTGTMPAGASVAFPAQFVFEIPAGQTGALYIMSEDPTRIGYRNGSVVGAPIAADANITVQEGQGRQEPDFTGPAYQPRAFAGSIQYQLGTPFRIPTLSEWSMILLGLLLAGGAVVIVHQRRHHAA